MSKSLKKKTQPVSPFVLKESKRTPRRSRHLSIKRIQGILSPSCNISPIIRSPRNVSFNEIVEFSLISPRLSLKKEKNEEEADGLISSYLSCTKKTNPSSPHTCEKKKARRSLSKKRRYSNVHSHITNKSVFGKKKKKLYKNDENAVFTKSPENNKKTRSSQRNINGKEKSVCSAEKDQNFSIVEYKTDKNIQISVPENVERLTGLKFERNPTNRRKTRSSRSKNKDKSVNQSKSRIYKKKTDHESKYKTNESKSGDCIKNNTKKTRIDGKISFVITEDEEKEISHEKKEVDEKSIQDDYDIDFKVETAGKVPSGAKPSPSSSVSEACPDIPLLILDDIMPQMKKNKVRKKKKKVLMKKTCSYVFNDEAECDNETKDSSSWKTNNATCNKTIMESAMYSWT